LREENLDKRRADGSTIDERKPEGWLDCWRRKTVRVRQTGGKAKDRKIQRKKHSKEARCEKYYWEEEPVGRTSKQASLGGGWDGGMWGKGGAERIEGNTRQGSMVYQWGDYHVEEDWGEDCWRGKSEGRLRGHFWWLEEGEEDCCRNKTAKTEREGDAQKLSLWGGIWGESGGSGGNGVY
jgi:hypothetical protein